MKNYFREFLHSRDFFDMLKAQYHFPERKTNELQNGIYWDRRIRWELPDWTLDRYVLIWCQYLSRSSKPSFVCPMSSSTLDMARDAAMSRSFFFFISSSRSCSFLFCISFLAASLKNIKCNLRFFNIADLSRLNAKISHYQLTLPEQIIDKLREIHDVIITVRVTDSIHWKVTS